MEQHNQPASAGPAAQQGAPYPQQPPQTPPYGQPSPPYTGPPPGGWQGGGVPQQPPPGGPSPAPKNRRPLIIALAVGMGLVILALVVLVIFLVRRPGDQPLQQAQSMPRPIASAGVDGLAAEADRQAALPPAGQATPLINGETPPVIALDEGAATISLSPGGFDFVPQNITDKTITYSEYFGFCYDAAGAPVIGADGNAFEWFGLLDEMGPGSSLALAQQPPWTFQNCRNVAQMMVVCCYAEFEDGTTWGQTSFDGEGLNDSLLRWAKLLGREADRLLELRGAGTSVSAPPATQGSEVLAFVRASDNPAATMDPPGVTLYPDGFFVFTWPHHGAGNVDVFGDWVQNGDEVHCTAADGSYYGSSVYGFVEQITFRYTADGALEFLYADLSTGNRAGAGYLEAGTILQPAAPPALLLDSPRRLGNYLDATSQARYPVMLELTASGRFSANVANLEDSDIEYALSGTYSQQGNLLTLTLDNWIERDYLAPGAHTLTFLVQDEDHLVYQGPPLGDLTEGTTLGKVPPLASGQNQGVPEPLY